MAATTTLPPGQVRIDGFPRFGIRLHGPAPRVPAEPVIEVTGAMIAPVTLPLAGLASLPRTQVRADFHCVSGWTATGLTWEGVAFADFYQLVVAPALRPGTEATYAVFVGLDGYRSIVLLEDVLATDVLLADRLDGLPLTGDHGAPVRLVSPAQYGFVSTKHLTRIELHASEPPAVYHPAQRVQRTLRLVRPHARARVWREERHRYLPAWAVRPAYRLVVRRLLGPGGG